jgi:hypothetical protein
VYTCTYVHTCFSIFPNKFECFKMKKVSQKASFSFQLKASRVARWYIFKPKSTILVYFVSKALGMETFDTFYCYFVYILCGHFLYFMTIWYFMRSCIIFSSFLVYCIMKNLAALEAPRSKRSRKPITHVRGGHKITLAIPTWIYG